MPLETLDQMYEALARSHIDCDIIYHEASQQNQLPLGITLNSLMEKVAVTATRQGSNRSKLYEELLCETLPDRRRCRCILQVHKMSNDKTPLYLKDKLPTHGSSLFGGNEGNTFHGLIYR